MRTITDHKVNGLNEAIVINAVDAPGPGGANHTYHLGREMPDRGDGQRRVALTIIEFQNGPISGPQDINGWSNEALAAILIDRMRGFQYGRKEDGSFDEAQRGKFACRENACALTHFEEGLMWLQKRTRDRMARGVEGRLVK